MLRSLLERGRNLGERVAVNLEQIEAIRRNRGSRAGGVFLVWSQAIPEPVSFLATTFAATINKYLPQAPLWNVAKEKVAGLKTVEIKRINQQIPF